MIELKGKTGKAVIMIDDVEEKCIQQVYNFISSPAGSNDIVIMPDCHAGSGSVIGFTMPFTDKIIPNTVGVDIGCGMLSANIGNVLPIEKYKLDEFIRLHIPMGMTVHTKEIFDIKNRFPWKHVNELGREFIMSYNKKFGAKYPLIDYSYDWFIDRCKTVKMDAKRAVESIGTMGGGNHFIEIGQSPLTNDYWITVHSGSRNFGKVICEYHQIIAENIFKSQFTGNIKDEVEHIKATADKKDIQQLIINARAKCGTTVKLSGLEYLTGQAAMDYFNDMVFAQVYAQVNRSEMMNIILREMNVKAKESIETIHNYIDFNDFIIRKGAIRSYTGERMIIPLNMQAGILICEGKSNADWNFSAPHGAGRLYSRAKCKKELSIETFEKSMEGILCTNIGHGTLDECPQAYKDPEMIKDAIDPTATILDQIKPIIAIKDGSEQRDFKKNKKNKKD
jgi:RNA-splicing ligase RtcB